MARYSGSPAAQSGASSSQGLAVGIFAGNSAISAGDLVQIGGKYNSAVSVENIDFAKNAAASTLLAQTSVIASSAIQVERSGAAQDQHGNTYVLAPYNTSGQGVMATKYSSSGSVVWQKNIDVASGGAQFQGMRATLLSNGNILFSWCSYGGTCTIEWIIYDANGAPVKARTAQATATYSNSNVAYHEVTAISGGFVLSYVNAALTQQLFAAYSNAGVQTQAEINIQTHASLTLAPYQRMAQLPNGNIVVLLSIPNGTNSGTRFLIVSTSGAVVKTLTAIDTQVSQVVDINVLSAYFCVLCGSSGNAVAYAVYDQAGTLQGSKQTETTFSTYTYYPNLKVVNDGLKFYVLWPGSTGIQISIIGTNGALVVKASDIGTGSIGVTGSRFDAVVTSGVLIVFATNGTTQQYYVVGLPDAPRGIVYPYIIAGPTTVGSAATTTGCRNPTVLSNGDFTATFVYDQQSVAGTFISIVKFAASAIVGVASSAVAPGVPGTPVPVFATAGQYSVNPMGGAAATAFDHSSATPVGNKGILFNAGVTLRGL